MKDVEWIERERIARQDRIDNLTNDFLEFLSYEDSTKPAFEWDIEIIGNVRDYAIAQLVAKGFSIEYPTMEESDD